MPHANVTHPVCNEYVTFRKPTTQTHTHLYSRIYSTPCPHRRGIVFDIVYSRIVGISLRSHQRYPHERTHTPSEMLTTTSTVDAETYVARRRVATLDGRNSGRHSPSQAIGACTAFNLSSAAKLDTTTM